MSSSLARTLPPAMILVLLLIPVAIRMGWLAPLAGFGLFMLGWIVGGAGASILCALAWRQGDQRGALVSGALGTLLLASLLLLGMRAKAPPIHDITTAPMDPPVFTAAARHPDNEGRDLAYPVGGSEVPDRQRDAYPDLRTIRVASAPEPAQGAVVEAAERLGWTVIHSDPDLGVVEAYEVTTVFRFVDDIVVRIRAADTGAKIDVRSTSRVGRSDLGANAARIRRLAAALGDPF